MKKLFITLLLLSAVLGSKANHNLSSLNITSVDGGYFTIAVDRPQFEAPSAGISVDDLVPGNHYIKIARWVDNVYHPGYKTVFAGYVFVPKQSVMTGIVMNNHFKVTDIRPILVCQEPVEYQTNYHYPPAPVCHSVNEYDFNQMLSSIEHKSFESTRMQLAKQLINNNFFTSRQVTRLLNTMTFESTKLELAKYAYHKTVDRNNYFLVNDSFTFESSITDLSMFISSQG